MIRLSVHLFLLLILIGGHPLRLHGSQRKPNLVVDGKLAESLWASAETIELLPTEKGVPRDLAASARVMSSNGQLYLGITLPEPGGKVLAYSVGYNPKWEKNASTYFLDLDRLLPPAEDRLICSIGFVEVGGEGSTVRVEVNPWGALRVERNGELVPSTKILCGTSISEQGWEIELTIPLVELSLEPLAKTLSVNLEQIRSRRPLAPEFRWETEEPLLIPFTKSGEAETPRRQIAGIEALQVGRVQALPPLESRWEDSFWSRVPALELSRNEARPRRPQYATQVKWAHDGRKLALLFRCQEDTRVVCNLQKRDDRIEIDDHVCIYLATSGSSLVEILVNPTGAVKDQEGIRSNLYFNGIGEWRKKGYAYTNWNANIQVFPLITKDHWTVRVNVPLDEVASVLGSLGVPKDWKVLLGRVRQERLGEAREVSSLPVIESPSFRAPARYQSMKLSRMSPSKVPEVKPAFTNRTLDASAGRLARLDSSVMSRLQKRYRDAPSMLAASVGRRVTSLALEEHREWNEVKTLEDWEEFRDKRMDLLEASFGNFPETRGPLNLRVTSSYRGEGFQVRNIVFESRPGVFVPANLYLPLEPERSIPAIIINPGHGMPKTQEVNKDCGMIWARNGCAVLVPDKVGHGERIETLPWNNQAYYSEELHDMQLGLVCQSRQGWIAWDISRAVDCLLELGFVDPKRIILMGGATWGGGPTAAVAGFFEDRLAATVIFNFGRVYWYTGGGWRLKNCTTNKIADWFFCASKAPRKFVYAHEFWYEGEEGPSYPSVWVPAWPRYERVYGFYGATDDLAIAQSDGLLRLDTGHCGSIDHVARREIYPLLKKWFGIPLPSQEDQSIEIDSQYGPDRPDYPLVKFKESQRRMPDKELVCINPEVNAELDRRALHEIAWQRGAQLLEAARNKRANRERDWRRQDLIGGLSEVLGDVEPPAAPKVEQLWSRKMSEVEVEGLIVHPEAGVFVPLLLLKPGRREAKSQPLVLAVAEGGKDRFLKHRSQEIVALLEAGIAVCLPDLRGTGETAADQYKTQSHDQLYSEIALGNTLVGLRLRDVRTVLAYLRTRENLDSKRFAIWGDSFAVPNETEIWVDELARTPVSPQIQHMGSPLGSVVALLAALYEPEIAAVAVRGGLISYLSLLESPFVYVPFDISVPEILREGDVPDICAALAPMPLLMEQLIGGRNFVVQPGELVRKMAMASESYEREGASARLIIRLTVREPRLDDWLVEQLVQ